MEIINITFKAPNSNLSSTTIHLSKTIQLYLRKKNSKIELDKTIDGELAIASAFLYRELERGFNASKEFFLDFEKDRTEDFYIIYLSLRNLNVGRAKINTVEKLAELVYDWLDRQIDLEVLQEKYTELEKFKPIYCQSEKKTHEWNKIKRHIFNYSKFYLKSEIKWINSYEVMLKKISGNPNFEKFTPFTSHFRLHLNNAEKSLPWHYIIPTIDGKYRVAKQNGIEGEKVQIDEMFESLDKAILFYSNLLENLDDEKS